MPKNYIVLRHSPDWLSFDEEQSRSFLSVRNLPETAVIDFMTVWDAGMAVDYRSFRHAIKLIAMETIHAVEGSTFLSHAQLRAITPEPDDLIVFTDDDDWLAPDLFVRLHEAGAAGDGAKWGSIKFGPAFFGEPNGLYFRPIDNQIYTNNAAVSGRVIQRLGIDSVFEHGNLKQRLDSAAYAPSTLAQYLSLANKHPCCTLTATVFLMRRDSFRSDPKAEIRSIATTLNEACASLSDEWFVDPMNKLQALIRASIGDT